MTFSTYFSPGVALQGGGGSGGGGAASLPISGNGATITASTPLIDGTQTWNNAAVTFTGAKLNITDTASNAASLLMDLQVGGASRANVRKDGRIISNSVGASNVVSLGFDTGGVGNLTGVYSGIHGQFAGVAQSRLFFTVAGSDAAVVNTGGLYLLGDTISFNASMATTLGDLLLTRRGAANLRLGAADAAAPVAQTLSVQSVVAGTTNTAGTNLTITGSQGTGTGAGGSIVFQVAPAGSSGSAQNALATALTINSARQAVIESAGTAAAPTLVWSGDTTTGFYKSTGNIIDLAFSGVQALRFSANGLFFTTSAGRMVVSSGGAFAFSSGTAGSGGDDVILARDAANTLALRNSTAAQTFRLYATETSTLANFQRLVLSSGVTANMAIVAADNGGTGVAMGLQFGAALTTGGGVTNIMNINTSGHLVWNTDNTYDIGAASATRPRNIYAATSILATGATAVIGYGTGSGGVVTQTTGRTTGVTLNKANGQITLVSAAGTATWQSFTVTNSTVAATDTIVVNQDAGTDLYQIFVTNVAAGSFRITFATTGGTTTEQPVFNFAVIKAVAA